MKAAPYLCLPATIHNLWMVDSLEGRVRNTDVRKNGLSIQRAIPPVNQANSSTGRREDQPDAVVAGRFGILRLIALALIGVVLVAYHIHHRRTDVLIVQRQARARCRRLPTHHLDPLKARYDAALLRRRCLTLPITSSAALMNERPGLIYVERAAWHVLRQTAGPLRAAGASGPLRVVRVRTQSRSHPVTASPQRRRCARWPRPTAHPRHPP